MAALFGSPNNNYNSSSLPSPPPGTSSHYPPPHSSPDAAGTHRQRLTRLIPPSIAVQGNPSLPSFNLLPYSLFLTPFHYPFSLPLFITPFRYPFSLPLFVTPFHYPFSLPPRHSSFGIIAVTLISLSSRPSYITCTFLPPQHTSTLFCRNHVLSSPVLYVYISPIIISFISIQSGKSEKPVLPANFTLS